MKKQLCLLFIHQQPLSLNNLQSYWKPTETEICIHTASNGKDSYEKICKNKYNIILLHINIPEVDYKAIRKTLCFAKRIKKQCPDAKFILSVSSIESYKIYKAFASLNPDACIVQSAPNPENICEIITSIFTNSSNYYHPTILSVINNIKKHPLLQDLINYDILYLVSLGIQTKNLHQYIPLSTSAIEKRKRQLKEYFDVPQKGDEHLLQALKKKKIL